MQIINRHLRVRQKHVFIDYKIRVPTRQGNLFFLQGQGKVGEFCKMVREIRKSSKVREF